MGLKLAFNAERYRGVMEEARRRLEAARSFEEADRVPIHIGVAGPFFCSLFRYTFKEYYRNLDVCYKVQLQGFRWLFEVLKDDRPTYSEHLDPDIGATMDGVVFGCEISLPDEGNPWLSPWIIPRIKSVEDIESFEVPSPEECERRLEKHYLRAFGKHIDARGKVAMSHPPLSASGSLMGTLRLYIYLYRYPSLMHKLFEKLLKTFMELIEHKDRCLGASTEAIGLADDHAGYLSEEMYRRFVLPYNKRIYERYGRKGRSLHMDSQADHIAHIIADELKVEYMDLGAGSDIAKIKKVFDGKVVFKGNINSKVLVAESFEEIRKETEHCIQAAAPGGGYIFDVGGETYAGIDVNRLLYMVNYAKKIGKYPVKSC